MQFAHPGDCHTCQAGWIFLLKEAGTWEGERRCNERFLNSATVIKLLFFIALLHFQDVINQEIQCEWQCSMVKVNGPIPSSSPLNLTCFYHLLHANCLHISKRGLTGFPRKRIVPGRWGLRKWHSRVAHGGGWGRVREHGRGRGLLRIHT